MILAVAVCSSLISSCTLARDLDSTKQWLVYMEAAHAARLQAHYPEAERLYCAALKEAERPKRQNRLVAASLDSLGKLYLDQRRYDQAERFYLQAVETGKAVLDDTDPDLASYLDDLANCYASEKNYEKAEHCYQSALAIWTGMSGWEHKEDLAFCRARLADLYYLQNKYSDAEPLYRQAMPVLAKARLTNRSLLSRSKKNYEDILRQLGRKR